MCVGVCVWLVINKSTCGFVLIHQSLAAIHILSPAEAIKYVVRQRQTTERERESERGRQRRREGGKARKRVKQGAATLPLLHTQTHTHTDTVTERTSRQPMKNDRKIAEII